MFVKADYDKPHRCPICWGIPDKARKHRRARKFSIYSHCGVKWNRFYSDATMKDKFRFWLWKIRNSGFFREW